MRSLLRRLRYRHDWRVAKSIWSWVVAVVYALAAVSVPLLPAVFPKTFDDAFHKQVGLVLEFFALALIAIFLQVVNANRPHEYDPSVRHNGTISRFDELYAKSVSDSIAVVHDLENYTEEELQNAFIGILRLVCTIVRAYYRSDHLGDKDGINANIMRPAYVSSFDEQTVPYLKFLDYKLKIEEYTCVLQIVAWAVDPLPDIPQVVDPQKLKRGPVQPSRNCPCHRWLSLPVAKGNDLIIFGAPRVFQTGVAEAIGDIKDRRELLPALEGHSVPVQTEILQYFDSCQSFNSFLSMPVKVRNQIVGVLNVQSAQPYAFGSGQKIRDGIRSHLDPFCAALAAIVDTVNQSQKSDAELRILQRS